MGWLSVMQSVCTRTVDDPVKSCHFRMFTEYPFRERTSADIAKAYH
jgi:hypothetical protein